MRILREVQEGKLSKPEATRLLQNLALIQQSEPQAHEMPAAVRDAPGLMNPRMLRIRKRHLQTNETIYEFVFQASLIEAAKRIGARFSPSLDKLTHKEIENLLLTHVPGILFDEEDPANQTCIESFLF
ncbi:MAG TPA: hypothetical protein VLR89_08975, partial [Anaerolineaceae bacterium]|nr:hypothetical protein [Anaerolineaceae bacterium]